MTVSIVLTVNNRPPEVSRAVANSLLLPGNQPNELIVVLDRPTPEAKGGALAAYNNMPFPVLFPEINGPQGWICPANAWNKGYQTATSQLLYCISSEVIQQPHNLTKAATLNQNLNLVVFGACTNSTPAQLVTGAKPGVLASANIPRPLGFIAAVPANNLRKIGGNDTNFMNGLWYEDDDLYIRLWQSGLNFLFTNHIHGTHIHHERPNLNTAKILANQQIMIAKHGSTQPWNNIPRTITQRENETLWEHP